MPNNTDFSLCFCPLFPLFPLVLHSRTHVRVSASPYLTHNSLLCCRFRKSSKEWQWTCRAANLWTKPASTSHPLSWLQWQSRYSLFDTQSTHVHTKTHTQKYTQIFTITFIHLHTYTQTHTQTNMHTRAHSQAHIHTHTCTHRLKTWNPHFRLSN